MATESIFLLGLMTLLQGANFWYLSTISTKMSKMSNGCFARHIELAKREGQNEMTLRALHERADRLETMEQRIDARAVAQDMRAVAADRRDVVENERER